MTSSPDDRPRAVASVAGRSLLLAVCVALLALVVHLAGRSDTTIVENSVLDDGAYFAKLARNLVNGEGYALDGLHVTNGVQPFWAAIVVALAWCFADDPTLLRAMMIVGAAAWLGGALLLARLLRPRGAVAAVTAAIGFALAGFEGRRAFTGMENGVHGFLLLATLWAADTALRDEPGTARQRRRTWWFGIAAAALALNRVEYGLLVVMLGGYWAQQLVRRLGIAAAWRVLAPFLLPLVAGALLWSIPSWLCTGAVLPISGTVKAHVNTLAAAQAAANGTVVGFVDRWPQMVTMFGSHALLPQMYGSLAALLTVGEMCGSSVATTLGFVPTVAWVELIGLFGLLIGGVAAIVSARPGTGRLRAPRLLFVAFAVVHVTMFAFFLGYHSTYCSWHSVGEIACIWLLVGEALGAMRGGSWRGLQWLVAVVVVMPLGWRWAEWWRAGPHPEMQYFAPLVRCGYWLERNLPAGARVGSFNTGLMAMIAKSHRVTNLDGLVNTPAYFRDYYRAGRVGDYLRDEGIHYVADSFGRSGWTTGETPRLLGPQPRLLWFQRAPGDHHAACVFELASAPRRAPSHPLATLQFRAQFEQALPVHTTAALLQLPSDQRVVASFTVPPSEQLFHVVMPKAEAARAVTIAADSPVTSVRAPVVEGVQVVAVDLPLAPVLAGTVLQLTVFCQVDERLDTPRELAVRYGGDGNFDLAPGPGVLQTIEALAHGTVGNNDPGPAGVVAHGTALRVPLEQPEGELTVRCALRRPGGRWQVVELGTVVVVP